MVKTRMADAIHPITCCNGMAARTAFHPSQTSAGFPDAMKDQRLGRLLRRHRCEQPLTRHVERRTISILSDTTVTTPWSSSSRVFILRREDAPCGIGERNPPL